MLPEYQKFQIRHLIYANLFSFIIAVFVAILLIG